MTRGGSDSDMVGAGLGIVLILAAVLWKWMVVAAILLVIYAAILILGHRE